MIEELLKNKSAKEKAQIKAKELDKVKIGKFKAGDLDIEIVGDIEEIEGGIQLFVRAWRNGEQLGFSKDGSVEIERFRIYNPPVLVDDSNGDIIRESEIDGEIKQRKLKYDPTSAIKQSLIHTISLVGKENTNIVIGKIGNTTSTFYPDAGTGVTAADGTCRMYYGSDTGQTWNDLRNGAGDDAEDTNGYNNIIGTSNGPTGFPQVLRRGIINFDTSSLSSDTINSATLSLYGREKNQSNYSTDIEMQVYSASPASAGAVVAGDFDSLGSTPYCDTNISYTSFSTAGYNDFSLNSAGKSAINGSGVSNFGFRDAIYDVGESAPPTGNWDYERISVYFADQAGTSEDPKLVVEHAAAGLANLKTFNGVAAANVKTIDGTAIASVKSINTIV